MKTHHSIVKYFIWEYKLYFTLVLLIITSFDSPAQTNKEEKTIIIESKDSIVNHIDNDNYGSEYVEPNEDSKIYSHVEEPAAFPGGETARLDFLKNNLRYPDDAEKKGLQGTVFVKFVIEIDGSITNVFVARGVCPSIDDESLRLTKLMPKWLPTKISGKPVRSSYVMQIKFSLPD